MGLRQAPIDQKLGAAQAAPVVVAVRSVRKHRHYARAVIDADPAVPAGAQDLVLEAMLTRQQVILEERRPELAVIIEEAALHQVGGGTAVMRAQLARLAEMSGTHSQITIQILPFATGAPPGVGNGPLSILRFADTQSPGVVHPLGPCGGICLDSPPDVASHARAFSLLKASALTPAATARLLPGMAHANRRRTPPLAQTANTRAIITAMPVKTAARALLESLVGQPISTVTGRPNTVLRVEGDSVVVATSRSPTGQPVPIEWVQSGLEQLLETGEIEVSVPSLGHRSSFVGAVLLTLPGAILIRTVPPRIRLNQPATA